MIVKFQDYEQMIVYVIKEKLQLPMYIEGNTLYIDEKPPEPKVKLAEFPY